jgi:HemY protein
MRAALWLISLFALASAGAWLAWNNPGSVSFFWPPYRVDVSLNLLLLAVGLLVVLVVLAQRALSALLALPRQAQRWRLQQIERSAHAALLEAMGHFMSGRFLRARKAAELTLEREAALNARGELLEHAPALRTVAHVMASEAAHALQDKAVRQSHLQRALGEVEAAPATLRTPLLQGLQLRSARWWLDDRDAQASLQQLANLPPAVGRRLVAMRIALKAARLAGQPLQALETALLLAKHKAFSPAVTQSLLRSLTLDWLRQVHDPETLRRHWQPLPLALRQQVDVAAESAQRWLALGGDPDWALSVLLPVWAQLQQQPSQLHETQAVRAVQSLWAALAVASAAECRHWLARLDQAQRERPREWHVLYLAGMLCHRLQLWGKAQQHLQQVVALPGNAGLQRSAWVTLAQLADQRGDGNAALQAWQQAAQL